MWRRQWMQLDVMSSSRQRRRAIFSASSTSSRFPPLHEGSGHRGRREAPCMRCLCCLSKWSESRQPWLQASVTTGLECVPIAHSKQRDPNLSTIDPLRMANAHHFHMSHPGAIFTLSFCFISLCFHVRHLFFPLPPLSPRSCWHVLKNTRVCTICTQTHIAAPGRGVTQLESFIRRTSLWNRYIRNTSCFSGSFSVCFVYSNARQTARAVALISEKCASCYRLPWPGSTTVT